MHGLYVALWFIIIIIESVCECVIGRVCAVASHSQLACTAHSCHIVCVTSSSSSCTFGLKFTHSKKVKGSVFYSKIVHSSVKQDWVWSCWCKCFDAHACHSRAIGIMRRAVVGGFPPFRHQSVRWGSPDHSPGLEALGVWFWQLAECNASMGRWPLEEFDTAWGVDNLEEGHSDYLLL